jgi:hypothetical protein
MLGDFYEDKKHKRQLQFKESIVIPKINLRHLQEKDLQLRIQLATN